MLTAHNEDARIRGKKLVGLMTHEFHLADFDSEERINGALDNFEVFSRFCEAWSRAARKETL